MKSNFSLNSIPQLVSSICLVVTLGLFTTNAKAQGCQFVGLDSLGNVAYTESIACSFPILMGNTATDSINYQQAVQVWYSIFPLEMDYPNHYYVIGWYEFLGQSEDRREAMKRQPHLYHVLPRDYQSGN
jgi:hypothetical protein